MISGNEYLELVAYAEKKYKNGLPSSITPTDVIHELLIENPDITVLDIKRKMGSKFLGIYFANRISLNPDLPIEMRRRWKFKYQTDPEYRKHFHRLCTDWQIRKRKEDPEWAKKRAAYKREWRKKRAILLIIPMKIKVKITLLKHMTL